MRILFVFVDGIGLGDRSDYNPFSVLSLPAFERLAHGAAWLQEAPAVHEESCLFRPIDPRLSIDGLPQSGTGQASLFTGVNCARVAGRHYGPYPHSKTKPIIAEHNIFRQIEQEHPHDVEPAAFANAYPERFFDYVEKTDRWTVTTRCCLDSGARIRSGGDLAEGLAVPADLTGRGWPDRFQPELMPRDEAEAARRLLRITAQHRLTLFEYFLTDKAGHQQSHERAAEVLTSLDRLLGEILRGIDTSEMLLVLTSDHGNLEDLSTKTHTFSDVPFVAFGAGAGELGGVRSLVDVTPALVRLSREDSQGERIR